MTGRDESAEQDDPMEIANPGIRQHPRASIKSYENRRATISDNRCSQRKTGNQWVHLNHEEDGAVLAGKE